MTIDLSRVSYVATDNWIDPLASPDRFRVIEFAKPTDRDLSALVPTVIADQHTRIGKRGSYLFAVFCIATPSGVTVTFASRV